MPASTSIAPRDPHARRPRALWPGLAVLGMCLAGATVVAQTPPPGGGQPPADAGKQRRGLKVAVVDIGVLFRDYKRKEKLENDVNAERDRIRKQLEGDAEELQRRRKNFDSTALTPGSDAWLALRDEIKQAQYVYEMKSERLQGVLKKRVEELTLQILTELQRTIRAYGERHGYDLILKSDENDGAQGPGELAQQFQERIFRAQISDILFHSDAVDITEAIKRDLNSDANLAEMDKLEQQQRQQRSQPPPPAPPPPATPPAGTGAPTAPPK